MLWAGCGVYQGQCPKSARSGKRGVREAGERGVEERMTDSLGGREGDQKLERNDQRSTAVPTRN